MSEINATYVLEKKSVNSKSLFDEIHKYVDSGISDTLIMWSSDSHREMFSDLIDEYLENLEYDGKIDQPNVILDLRNNPIMNMDRGIYVLEIQYRQRNCENTTRLIYTITDQLIKNIKDLVDFDLTP